MEHWRSQDCKICRSDGRTPGSIVACEEQWDSVEFKNNGKGLCFCNTSGGSKKQMIQKKSRQSKEQRKSQMMRCQDSTSVHQVSNLMMKICTMKKPMMIPRTDTAKIWMMAVMTNSKTRQKQLQMQ